MESVTRSNRKRSRPSTIRNPSTKVSMAIRYLSMEIEEISMKEANSSGVEGKEEGTRENVGMTQVDFY